ncbi:ABC transporter permease [Xanthovirga aplysinae]|uniref:ABC transporter permease n=1 Tax=Xanthovirga aplysinae TaxID=2529853 RepID=UPI0012BC3344|nr:ABC transporter permease [Xanthovirga aplysinae]MTI32352.1 ABC transporter permease [Xanthovirga aplysinae]
MNKILLIISREYLSRVRKKSFIIMTFLGPLLFAGFTVVPGWLATRDSDKEYLVEVIDDSGLFTGKLQDKSNIHFEFISQKLEMAKEKVSGKKDYSLLYIPPINIDDPQGITYYSEGSPSLEVVGNIKGTLRSQIEAMKLKRSNLDQETIDQLKTKVSIETINMSAEGEKKSSAGLATAVGYIGAFLMYMFIFLYGAQVMHGVIEEKSSRIVEVIISSVKPFQLMAGKVFGIAAVGLTQFLLWAILTGGITTGISTYLGGNQVKELELAPTTEVLAQAGPEGNKNISNSAAKIMQKAFDTLESVNLAKVAFCFFFFFLGGYLLYAALFAAVGSAVDSVADSQQFMFPITIPLIFSIIMLTAVLREPDGTLATVLSYIPFTSPVVMMMRIPFGVADWQIALSMLSLVLGFGFTTWVAGRIYRVGILMHGTKVNYKVLAKWFLMKN